MLLKKFNLLLLVLISIIVNQQLSFSQTSTKKEKLKKVVVNSISDQSILLQVGNEKISAKQLSEAYKKNGNRSGKNLFDQPKDTIIEFINLYANYRLKVLAALDSKYDLKPEIIKEMADNRKQLATPTPPSTGFLLERKLVDPAIEKMWKNRKNEWQFSAIYISMRPNDPADTLRAFKKANLFLDGIKSGKFDFLQLATDSTDDPNTKSNKGVLPYITGGMILKSMENAVLNTKVGEVYPNLVKVPAGYVIIKVIDISPRIKIRGGHIIIRDPLDKNKDNNEIDFSMVDSLSLSRAKNSADSVYKRLKAGEDFSKLAKTISNDKVTAAYGGEYMQFYTRSMGFEGKPGKLAPEIENRLYKLKDGEYSEPFRTKIGIMILKRFSSSVPLLNEEEDKLRQVYRQYYLNEDKSPYIKSILIKRGYKLNDGVFNELLNPLDRSKTANDTNWSKNIPNNIKSKNLYSFNGKSYSVQSWIDSVNTNKEFAGMPLTSESMNKGIESLLEQQALELEAISLEEEYPEFKTLLNEFRDGTLIFKIENDEVWNNVKFDSIEAKTYFEANRKKYISQAKLGISEIYMFNEKDIKDVYLQTKSNITFDSLASIYTQRLGYRERKGKYDVNTSKNSELVKLIFEKFKNLKTGDILEPMKYQDGYSIFKIDSYEPEKEMTYNEARQEISGDFMDYKSQKMTRDWLLGLGKKYGVKINSSILH
ncbi:MAG: peptidylprolyl isomerase [Chlorobiota bacterium]|jgi:peptidyl-prolyl cis-trans isomerase SurA|nr:peptidylprolyl isomerase [Chlorobiota bacterium]QQS65568.1 MAG: peptidylprolyl isomerase [Chlorobiota bacterium]